jgi:hypothetical protein
VTCRGEAVGRGESWLTSAITAPSTVSTYCTRTNWIQLLDEDTNPAAPHVAVFHEEPAQVRTVEL